MTPAPDQTLTDWLAAHATARPDAIALEDAEGSVTFGDLQADVSKLASGLATLDIGKGDTVGVQLPNTRTFVTAFLAIAARGAIVQTLHMPYRKNELRGLLADSAAKTVVVTHADKDSRAEDALAVRNDLPTLRHILTAGPGPEGCLALAELVGGPAEPVAITTEDTYLLLYTSGTTAAPKGVPHVYRSFLNNALVSATEMGIDETARILSLAPMTHLYGLFTLHMALATGATTCLLPAFNPATLANDLTRTKATHIYAAPAHFAPFIAAGALQPDHLRTARLLCFSGAAVPPSLAKAIDDLMPSGNVIQLWGMSELQAGTFGRSDDAPAKRFTTAGTAAPGTDLRILGDEGRQLPAGQEGALQIKGPSVFKGYLNRPDETEKSFTKDGWFATGDLAILDPDGFLTITGRTKEIINRGGVKFNPVEVEDILATLPGILQCAVVPLPDRNLGERGCLCVQLAPDSTLTLDDVTAHLAAAGLAKYKWPERLEVLETLPVTPTRKIMRGALIDQLKDTQ